MSPPREHAGPTIDGVFDAFDYDSSGGDRRCAWIAYSSNLHRHLHNFLILTNSLTEYWLCVCAMMAGSVRPTPRIKRVSCKGMQPAATVIPKHMTSGNIIASQESFIYYSMLDILFRSRARSMGVIKRGKQCPVATAVRVWENENDIHFEGLERWMRQRQMANVHTAQHRVGWQHKRLMVGESINVNQQYAVVQVKQSNKLENIRL